VLLPDDVDVDETFELITAPFAMVAITTVLRGSADGTSRLSLPRWGGVEHPEREVHGFGVTADDGSPLPTSHDPETGWVVEHAPGTVLHVHYVLASAQYDVTSEAQSYYRPIIGPSLFHLIGQSGLLYPEWVPESTPVRIAVHWRGFKEAKWTVASSFGVDQDGFRTTRPFGDLRRAVFLAGAIRLKSRDVGGHPLVVASAGTDWGFTDDDLVDLTARIVGAEREFFHDFDWPYFLVSAIPVGVYRPGASDYGGIGLTQSFALFLTPRFKLKSAPGSAGLPLLLAHEQFHLWNGGRYRLADPQGLASWFSEGFTNFFARRLLLRAGVIDLADYVANLNDEITLYLTSAVRNEPARRAATDSRSDESREKLPYLRGDVVAVLLDAEIRARSQGARSLDDLMREAVAPRSPAPDVDSETFLALVARYTTPAFADGIRQVVLDGRTAIVPSTLLEPCLTAHTEMLAPFDLGFDFPGSQVAHEVVGVVPDSSAYRAGLRNGQRITRFVAALGDSREPVELTVESAAGQETFSYLPQGTSRIAVPVFAAKTPTVESCRAVL
jgi:predicted metalloprotease with PDZ domain